jgi:PAS domain S-box-containing protein
MSDNLNIDLQAAIIKKASIGFVLLDSGKKVIFSNPIMEQISGYSHEELLGTDFFNSIVKDPKYLNLAMTKLSGLSKKPFDDLDLNIVRKDGKPAILHVIGSVFDDEGTIYTMLVVQDVTKKKEFEKVIESTYDNIMQSTIDLDAALKKIKEQRRVLEDYKAKIEHELKVAKTVQKSIEPKEFLENKYISVWGVSIPDEELGGDYFDFFEPMESKLGILIADVSGHGVPSALITTMIKVYFEKYAKDFIETEKVLSHVNSEVTRTLQETGFYLTAFYSIIDLDTMVITSTCAGHDFAICYDPKKDEVIQLGKTEKGTIIGSFAEAEYDSSLYQLEAGNKVLFFTDGITEARNKSGEFYGIEKVIRLLKNNKELGPHEFIDKLIEDVDEFSRESTAGDDRTVIMVDILNIPQPEEMEPTELKRIIDTAFKNGRRYVKQKQYGAAINEFLKIIKFDKNSSGAYSYLGQVFGVFGDLEKAENYLTAAIGINDSYVQGYYFLGIVLFKQKKYKEAKESWLKLKSLAGDFKNVNEYIDKIAKMGF